MSSDKVPSKAEVVVVGGGIIGCSTAYHLAKLGVRDVVLIEREMLTSGTTWHAAGVVGSLRASVFLTRLTVEACSLFPALESETGQATGYRRTGGLSIAQTPERLEELKRIPAIGALTGFEGKLLSPSEIHEKSPILETADLTGGVWIPLDGQTNPTDTTMAFARGARMHGARLYEHTTMTGLQRRARTAQTVHTSGGDIECAHVVLCCGMWTRHLAKSLGVSVPLQAVEHMYVVTEPMDNVPVDQPFIRDFDAGLYIKGDAGKLLIGAIDPIAKPWAVDSIAEDSAFTQLPEDWEHFEPFMEAALKRVPSLAETGIRQFLNGPESFTVDARHVLGRAPGYDNLYIAAGFNTTGIMSSAGAGSCIARHIVDGHPPMDTWEVDPQRFEQWSSTDRFIHERSHESPGLAFAMHWPYRQPETARDVKQSMVHDRLAAAGACFGVVAGWERPMWYAPAGVTPQFEYAHGTQSWWPHAAAEAHAVAQSVALFDQSQMAVFHVEGPDAECALQHLCANNVAVQPGRVLYTQMLNDRGGIEADITLTRLSEFRYRVVSGAPTRVHDLDWIQAGLADRESICIDVTSNYAIFSLMGPKSFEVLTELATESVGVDGIPYATSEVLSIGYATVEVQRLSYVGEHGYEIFVPAEFARHVYDALVETGRGFDLCHAGLLCMDSCRIEKGYRHWGHELSPSITPLEAGLGFAVDFSVPFVGRQALQEQRDAGLKRRVLLFAMPEHELLLLHDEPIYRNGQLVGETTSGARAFRVGGSLAFGLVRHEPGAARATLLQGNYEIQLGDIRVEARPLARAPYDPDGLKMRG